MASTRKEPGHDTRVYAMDHAVAIIAASNGGPNVMFKDPAVATVHIANAIADYIVNGPAEEAEAK